MSLRVKMLVPLALCGLILAAYLMWGSLPRSLQQVPRTDLLALLAVAFVLLLGAAWLVFEEVVAKPLARLAFVAGSSETGRRNEIAQLGRVLHSLREQLDQKQGAIDQVVQARKQAEQALQLSEERYVLAVRSANDGLWEWNLDSGEVYLSPRWKGMLGFGEDELRGTADEWRERMHPDDRPGVDAALQANLQGRTPRYEHEHRLLHKDGSVRWILSRGAVIRHASGKPYRMLGLDSDITLYKRIEATMQHVAAGTANVLGVGFYRALVMHFAQALNVAEAFVTECVDYPPTRVRTLACWERDHFIDDEYELAPTPCKVVFDSKERYFVPRDLALHFPNEQPYGFVSYLGIPILDSRERILGHLVFKDDKPMQESILMDAVYRIFTTRTAIEIERGLREKALLRVADGFASLTGREQRLGALVSEFAHYVGAREAFITRCLDDPPTRVRALCYWNEGKLIYDVEYDLPGNPCEQVIGEAQALYWPKSLAERWPLEREFNRESYLGLPLIDPSSGRVLGHLACCDDRPMSEQAPAAEALSLFAQRARDELLAQPLK